MKLKQILVSILLIYVCSIECDRYPEKQKVIDGQNWILNNENGRSLLFVEQKYNWHDARIYCLDRNSRLFTIPFSTQNGTINNNEIVENFKKSDYVWSGLDTNDELADKWYWNMLVSSEFYTPENEHNGKCGAAKLNQDNNVNTVKIEAKDCEQEFPFFCERIEDSCVNPTENRFFQRPGTDDYYLFPGQSAFYYEVDDFCKINNADIVHLKDKEEHDFVYDYIKDKNQKHVWLGALDIDKHEVFCWNSRAQFDFHNLKAVASTYEPAIALVRRNGWWIAFPKKKRLGIMCQVRCKNAPPKGKCLLVNREDVAIF